MLNGWLPSQEELSSMKFEREREREKRRGRQKYYRPTSSDLHLFLKLILNAVITEIIILADFVDI
jgi:hypothetical protein